jgi:NAD(P)H-dependent FMN reductase
MPEQAGRPIRIMVIIGSMRSGSYSRAAARFAAEYVTECGHQPLVFDPQRGQLAPADPAYHDDSLGNPDPHVQTLVKAARAADGFILASPVYHNSYSGLIKNMLDHLTIEDFYHKPVGLMAHGPNMAAVLALDHLRSVVRGLYGIAVPEQAVTVPADFSVGGNGGAAEPLLTSVAMQERIRSVVSSVLKLAGR